ncbi:alpha/beta hydrolase [Ruegeria pomeroyi]|nr:alpha/beta hydrolase [Ruegeria pomeroyi]
MLRPELYDDVMELWGSHIGVMTRDAELAADSFTAGAAGVAVDSELQQHFQRAHVILEQLGRKAPQSEMERRVEGASGHVILAGPDRKIRAASAQARMLLGGATDLTQLAAHLAPIGEQMLDRIVGAARSGDTRIPAVVLTTDLRPRHLIARVISSPEGNGQVMIEGLDYQWTPAAERVLVGSFGLSPAEIEIVRNLMEGRSLREIAQISGRSEHTVRNQAKSVLAKTGAPGQVDLIRLVAFLIDRGNQLRLGGHPGAVDLNDDVLDMGTGYRMQLYQCGDPGGRPVLYLHGMLDGMAPLEYLKHDFARRGLRVLAPVRPGYGLSDPVKGVEAGLRVMSSHALELMDRFALGRVAILGHMAGAVTGYVLRAGGDPRLAGMVAVAASGPLLRRAQLSGMARRQRMMAMTARWTPALLPFFVRAGIALIDSEEVQRFMDALYPPGSHERQVVDRLDLAALMHAGYRFAAQSGTAGFEADAFAMVSPWQRLCEGGTCPVVHLHGALDPVVPVDETARFAAGIPGASFHRFEEVGQFLIYERPDAVLDAIEAILPPR